MGEMVVVRKPGNRRRSEISFRNVKCACNSQNAEDVGKKEMLLNKSD
jgi:hypothetical protein